MNFWKLGGLQNPQDPLATGLVVCNNCECCLSRHFGHKYELNNKTGEFLPTGLLSYNHSGSLLSPQYPGYQVYTASAGLRYFGDLDKKIYWGPRSHLYRRSIGLLYTDITVVGIPMYPTS